MTTLTITSVTVVGTTVTMVGTLGTQTFPSLLQQQVTVPDLPLLNPNWSRNVQVSNQAVFIKRYGAPSFAFLLPSLTGVAYTVIPQLTFPPMLSTQPASLSVAHPNTAIFNVSATTEIPITSYQWQSSPDGVTWTNLTNVGVYSGVTTTSLGVSPTNVGLSGTQYRCIVTSPAGMVTSSAATLTVT